MSSVIKYAGITLIVILLPLSVFSQEVLYRKDGTKDSVKITGITTYTIVYIKWNRPTPIYTESKDNVLLIEYSDGSIDLFPPAGSQQRRVSEEKAEFARSLGRNIISFNLLNIPRGNIHLNYERMMSAKISFKYSINASALETNYSYSFGSSYRRYFTTGLDLNFYSSGQGKISYYLGPAVRMGRVAGTRNYTVLVGNNTGTYAYTANYKYISLLFSYGINLQPTKNLFIGTQLAVGLAGFTFTGYAGFPQTAPPLNPQRNFLAFDGIVSLNFGWRF